MHRADSTHRPASRSINAALLLAALLTLILGVATTSLSRAADRQVPQPKLSMAKARVIALQTRGGEITDEELETERGGSGLRYSFDIRKVNKTYEVGVDAMTGKVLENRAKGAKSD